MPRVVEVTTGSRLHFGMFSFGQSSGRQFGGAGTMIDAPGVRLRISSADRLSGEGPLHEKALLAAELASKAPWFARPARCHIEVLAAPEPHVGLGSGTQLALAVAAGLNAWAGGGPLAAAQLAQAVARGRRSAVGLHGFIHGGLVVEAGKSSADEIAPLVARVALPDEWRFVLVRSAGSAGLSGAEERQAFERLPPVPPERTARMCQEVLLDLLPAAAERNFSRFSESLRNFGEEAGRSFASLQGGIYAPPAVADVVGALVSLGVKGVGQSSWGPTVFAVLPSEQAANETIARLRDIDATRGGTFTVARPMNSPALIQVARH
ncbi:MAG: hypothetical protein HYX69_12910 [Planctomycetia bacterium]|nr:hypothetical protein [Planctomycetia bacterium]